MTRLIQVDLLRHDNGVVWIDLEYICSIDVCKDMIYYTPHLLDGSHYQFGSIQGKKLMDAWKEYRGMK